VARGCLGGAVLPERSEIIDVEMTTIVTAIRSPTALAAKPIAGGPARNSSQPIVETAAIPTPGRVPDGERPLRCRPDVFLR
jgi:hypothetical protein